VKKYQFKHQEMLLLDGAIDEERFIAYHKLFDELLLVRNIAGNRIFVAINLGNFTISSNAFKTEPLLRKEILPPFCFLVCRN
jgi:hypothetical protein